MPIQDLPSEIRSKLCSFLDPLMVARMSSVAKNWQELTTNEKARTDEEYLTYLVTCAEKDLKKAHAILLRCIEKLTANHLVHFMLISSEHATLILDSPELLARIKVDIFFAAGEVSKQVGQQMLKSEAAVAKLNVPDTNGISYFDTLCETWYDEPQYRSN